MIGLFLISLFAAGVIFAALHDVATMTIPNWLSAAFVLLFPVAAWSAGLGWAEMGANFLAGVIALFVCFGLFFLGIFGGGDAKLLPAVFLWLGTPALIPYIYGIAIVGGLLSLIILLSRKLAPKEVIPGFLQRSFVEGPGIPYAVAIAAGAIYAVPYSPLTANLIAPFLSGY